MNNLSVQTEELFRRQLVSWGLARDNFLQLGNVLTRNIDFDRFSITIQFNPGRIISSSARVDPKSVSERPCFLCGANRPAEQEELSAGNDMIILVNPFPIFSKHLTIPSIYHTKQAINGRFSEMLRLAKELPDYTIFYNGPECGASAPDHFHFQATGRNFLPIEHDFTRGEKTKLIKSTGSLKVFLWEDYLRGIISVRGSSDEEMIPFFDNVMHKLSQMQPGRPEPMINCLAGYAGNEWIVHLIPRKKHRPSQYFAGGDERILVSPASVDLGGVIVTPREEDYYNIDRLAVIDIFSQICFTENEVAGLI